MGQVKIFFFFRMSNEEERDFMLEFLRWRQGYEENLENIEIYNFGYEGNLPLPSIALTPDSDLKAEWYALIGQICPDPEL